MTCSRCRSPWLISSGTLVPPEATPRSRSILWRPSIKCTPSTALGSYTSQTSCLRKNVRGPSLFRCFSRTHPQPESHPHSAPGKFLIDKLKGGGHTETLFSQLQSRDRKLFEAPELADLLHKRLSGAVVAGVPCIDVDSSGRPSICDDTASGLAPETIWMGGAWAPKTKGRWRPSALNSRLRFCSYQPGGRS